MMKIFLLGPLFSLPSFAHMKSVFESMHGNKMSVSYTVLNSGKHILTVAEKTPASSGKPNFTERQVVDVPMKKNEFLSAEYGFKCGGKSGEYAYAVISKSKASEKLDFKPEQAWLVREKENRLDAVANANTVTCKWSPDGDSAYPFH